MLPSQGELLTNQWWILELNPVLMLRMSGLCLEIVSLKILGQLKQNSTKCLVIFIKCNKSGKKEKEGGREGRKEERQKKERKMGPIILAKISAITFADNQVQLYVKENN